MRSLAHRLARQVGVVVHRLRVNLGGEHRGGEGGEEAGGDELCRRVGDALQTGLEAELHNLPHVAHADAHQVARLEVPAAAEEKHGDQQQAQRFAEQADGGDPRHSGERQEPLHHKERTGQIHRIVAHDGDHGELGFSAASQVRGDHGGDKLEQAGRTCNPQIGRGVRHKLCLQADELHERGGEKEGRQARHGSHRGAHREAVHGEPRGALRFPGAQTLVDDHCGAGSQHGGGHDHHVERLVCHACRCGGVIRHAAEHKGVDCAHQGAQHLFDDNRNGEGEQCDSALFGTVRHDTPRNKKVHLL